MAIYEESAPSWKRTALFLALAFLVIYSPLQLTERELYWNEGIYAAVALEMNSFPPVALAHGELVDESFPLFPLLASWGYKLTGLGMESLLRGISVLALAALGGLVWEAGRRAVNIQAAAVAAAAVISSNIIIEKTLDGFPNTLGLVFLFSGWLVWFMYGAVRSQWNFAWVSGCFFCGLAFYTIGWEALLYFFVPLVFMRRPLTVWPRLRKPGFWLGLGLILFFVLLWGVPRWRVGMDIPFRSLPMESDLFSNYLEHLFMFPFDVAFRFMPWTLLAWAPFCVAYHPLDKNPIFSRFLRTIFITLFFVLWLSPGTNARDITLLAPPLSILIGINYWLLVRRHGWQLQWLFHYLSYVMVLAALVLALFYTLPPACWTSFIPFKGNLSFQSLPHYVTLGWIYSSLLLAIGVYLLWAGFRFYVWERIFLISVASMLFLWGSLYPYKAQENTKRELGRILKDALNSSFSSGIVVYKDMRISGLYGECYYMGCKIKKLRSYKELPKREHEVFVLSTEVPALPDRTWVNLLPARASYRDTRICLWKGTLTASARDKK